MVTMKEQQAKLVQIVKEAIQRDQASRKSYQVGAKFRFIQERLHTLLTHLEAHLQVLETQAKKMERSSGEDESFIYIYLFNIHGADLRSWLKVFTPKGLYEASVNRPVYLEESEIQSIIKHKKNKTQQAYLTIVLKKQDIVTPAPTETHPTSRVKIREGSLQLGHIISFTHNDHVYHVTDEGELVKKNER